MNTALWIVQILAALAFGMSGLMKISQPKEKLLTNMKWVEDFSPNVIKGIGALEVLGAVGLILPALTGVLPILTPIA
ncbi:MAG: DoxX family protein, partial [Anaerolineae bacterium]|nr:DoxX family protein [Anaerolineae bacterium]